MSEFKKESRRDKRNRDRRIYERYGLEAPQGKLKYNGTRIPCDIVDVSLGGCCIHTASRFVAGNLAQVEVEMPIHGMLLRMTGITQWTSRNNLVGVRFIHPSQRSKNELAGLLTCLVDKSAADVVAAAVVAAAAAPSAEQALNLEIPEELMQSLKQPETAEETAGPPQATAALSPHEDSARSEESSAPKPGNGRDPILPKSVQSPAALSLGTKPQEGHLLWVRRG